MTKHERMMADIKRHGERLLALYPNAVERDPVKLCKKLFAVEREARRYTTDYCNGDIQPDDDYANIRELDGKFLGMARAILGKGGTLMAQILAVEPPLMGEEKCVLQPMRAAEDIRRWLYERNYPVMADHVVLDAGRYYQVFSVGQPQAQKQPLPEGWPAGCFSLGYMAFFHREPLMKPLVEHMLATTRRKLRTQQADALHEQAAQLEQILHHWEMKP